MKRNLSVIALIASTFAAQAAPLADLSGGQTGRIEFQSTTPASRFSLIRNNHAQTQNQVVWGDLYMPKNTPPGTKVPAMIMSHGTEGVSTAGHDTYTEVWTRALNDAGIATFIVDTFTPRSLGNMSGSKVSSINIAANISDALHSLKLLATHPQIDANRIFHMGWSLGGTTVLDAAMPAIGKNVLPSGLRWAGSASLYPGCNIKWRTDHLGVAPAPILMLLGEIDDNTPAPACVDYAQTLARDGNPFNVTVFPGAGRDFDRREERPRQIQHGVYVDCNIEVKIASQSGLGTAYDFRQQKPINSFPELDAAIKSCYRMAPVTIAGQRQAREQSVKDVLAFIKSVQARTPVNSAKPALPADLTHEQRTEEILHELSGSKQ